MAGIGHVCIRSVKRIINRVPECLSSRLNWVIPLPPSQASVPPHLGPEGEPHTTGQTLWYNLYSNPFTIGRDEGGDGGRGGGRVEWGRVIKKPGL